MRITLLLPLLAMTTTACQGDSEEAPDPDFTLSVGFGDDTRGPFTSAGEVEDTTCGAWFPSEAQHEVELTENFLALHFLTDTVDAPFRVELGTNNSWCSDTDSTATPVVASGAWSAGTYRVFVGSPDEGGAATYDLMLAEGLPDGM